MTAGPHPGEAAAARHRRRVVGTLALSQVFSGIGNGSALAVGSVMAVELSGHPGWGGTASVAISLAGALTALPLARLALARGRRTALSLAYALAAVGTMGMLTAPVLGSYPLLLVSAGLVGVGAAGNLQARFAATDVATDATRARDLGLVVWAITVGAVAGPNLIGPGAALADTLGLPELSGPFLFSLAGLLVAILILQLGLRPDTLALAGGGRRAGPAPRLRITDGLAVARRDPRVRLGLAAVITAHAVMVGLMSMTPVHLSGLAAPGGLSADGPVPGDHAHHLETSPDTLAGIGLVISLHIAGMYALSPVMGRLADRCGRLVVVLGGFGILIAAAVTAGLGREHVPAVAAGLVLLGLGWSAVTVAGSAYVSELVTGHERVLVQGVTDAGMGAAGAVGAGAAGAVLALLGFGGLAAGVACVAALLAAWTAAVLMPARDSLKH